MLSWRDHYLKQALDAHTANRCLLTSLLLTMELLTGLMLTAELLTGLMLTAELLAGLLLTDVPTTKTSEISPLQSKR